MDNLQLQAEELEVLSSIYPEELRLISSKSFELDFSGKYASASINFILPENYPSESGPGFEVSAPFLMSQDGVGLIDRLNSVSEANKGESSVYALVDEFDQFLSDLSDSQCQEKSDDSNSLESEEKRIEKPPRSHCPCPKIFTTDFIEDRKSVFQGHCSVVRSVSEVDAFIAALKDNKKIARATHNIVGYKLIDKDTGIKHHDCDDDGETAADTRMMHLLETLGVDNVVVMVSRWYGGVHLGPDRFKHINNAARNALLKAGVINPASPKSTKKNKK